MTDLAGPYIWSTNATLPQLTSMSAASWLQNTLQSNRVTRLKGACAGVAAKQEWVAHGDSPTPGAGVDAQRHLLIQLLADGTVAEAEGELTLCFGERVGKPCDRDLLVQAYARFEVVTGFHQSGFVPGGADLTTAHLPMSL